MRAAKLAAAARALKCAGGEKAAAAPFSLAFMTDAARAPHPILIARALPKGSAVILRDYDAPARASLAAQLKSVCASKGLLLLIGADISLAEKLGADGVHMPSWFEGAAAIPETFIRTASCHNVAELSAAGEKGADLALLSPAFPTASHQGAPSLGAGSFRAMAARAKTPVLALGGVDETNARLLAGPNVAGLAAISAFLGKN